MPSQYQRQKYDNLETLDIFRDDLELKNVGQIKHLKPQIKLITYLMYSKQTKIEGTCIERRNYTTCEGIIPGC